MASEMMDGFIAGKMDSNGGGNCCMPVMPAYGYGMPWGMGMGMMGGYGMGGMWGEWIPLLLILALLGGGRFGGFGGGGCNSGCATQADLAAGFNNSAVLSSLNDIKLGQSSAINYNNQGFAGLNTAILQSSHGIENAVCNLGYQTQQGFNNASAQLAQCCCDMRTAIQGVNTGIERTGWNLSKQISDCCCDIEKMNMQNRFDAQGYNCNTLQAIDKLGDRIIGYLNNQETQNLREELQTYRLAASQANQNNVLMAAMDANKAEILRRTGTECPTAAFIVNPPTPVTFRQSCGCGCGCGCGNNGYAYGQGFAA